ncbi:hypothetical protein EYR41_000687 [Orbilia oligospora]|uniref:Uncharacterized protein n=1 Tax=Orbilia oligospora TaxID=2813651 RepID=A0A8H2E6X0_ORBOL|nr:hypothetical protein EYR41_000687 [Orbilia oligospora]
MSTSKNRGTYRALGIDIGTTEIQFTKALESKLRKGEEHKFDERLRPLIFMSHSFGGMVVAHAYVKTSGARGGDHKDIYDSVASLFFFGVPFSGIYLDDVLSMFKDKEKFPTHDQYDGIEITRQGPDLVNGIKYGARSSSIAITAFMDKVAENGVYVYSFYETDRTPMVAKLKNGQYGRSGKDVLVVSRDSALLKIAGLAELIAAQGDHSTIVKLKSLQDETYTTALSKL